MKIKESGFREYDARWLYPKDIDLEGIDCLLYTSDAADE